MKMTIPSKKFVEFVEKSSVGALTKEAQNEDRKKISPTDACIKISTNKSSVVFESSSQEASAICSVPISDDVIVELDGSFCVEASLYLSVLKTFPSDYLLSISYEEDKNYGKDMLSKVVEPNGKITTTSSKNKAEKRSGKNDTYPVDKFSQVDYNHTNVLFSINAKILAECVDKVLFARDTNDLSGIYDKVGVFVANKKLFFACTDGKRCAIFSVAEKDAKIKSDNQKILFDGDLFRTACKSFDKDDEIEVIDCEDKEHAMLSSGQTKVKLCVASEDVKQGFPNFISLTGLVLPIAIDVYKSDLINAIDYLTAYNSEKSIFYVKQGEKEIKIEAARGGTDSERAAVDCDEIKDSLQNPIALSNTFTKDGCKQISGEKVKISFSKDEKKVKIESLSDSSFIYFMQCMKPS